jgi:hypothetical protein
LEALASEIADNLGISEANVTLDVEYIISGTIIVDVDENISSEEVETMIESALVETLGIHPQYIETSYNPQTGEVNNLFSFESFYLGNFTLMQVPHSKLLQTLRGKRENHCFVFNFLFVFHFCQNMENITKFFVKNKRVLMSFFCKTSTF